MKSCTNLEAFHENLLQLVNNCHLTVGEAYYVIKDVTNELRFLYLKELQNELREPEKEEVESEFISFQDEESEKEEVMENENQNND